VNLTWKHFKGNMFHSKDSGDTNVFLGLNQILNIGLLSVFRENKTKLRIFFHKFRQSNVILYDMC